MTTGKITDRERSTGMYTPLPRAIREDHDPLQLLTGRGAGRLFAFWRWSDFRRPFCCEIFQRRYLPNEVRLGESERACASCGRAFDDRWPELSRSEKSRYVLPTPMMGVVGGLLICGLLARFAALRPHADVNWKFLGWTAVFCVLLLICFGALWFPRIWRSARRSWERRIGESE